MTSADVFVWRVRLCLMAAAVGLIHGNADQAAPLTDPVTGSGRGQFASIAPAAKPLPVDLVASEPILSSAVVAVSVTPVTYRARPKAAAQLAAETGCGLSSGSKTSRPGAAKAAAATGKRCKPVATTAAFRVKPARPALQAKSLTASNLKKHSRVAAARTSAPEVRAI
ncbi:MAG: hypothetical protein H0X13_14110 [Ramlibacter sp.]|nr:hypothetical protein [Ramlibacter sp.]